MAAVTTIPCRFCGKPARFIDTYLSPFKEDQTIFPESMAIYWCPDQSTGFAYPAPSVDSLTRYYNAIYRDRRRSCAEDPHAHYGALKSTPLVESQFMYLAQFINFDELQTVIDMGCGYGLLLRRIHQYKPEIKLVGIDLDPAVGFFLTKIGAEFLQASASASVEDICGRITDGTLLISSHTLHYQNDYAFIGKIISKIKLMGRKDINLFVEVPNDIVYDPDYVHSRVYDVPKLIFLTVDAFRSGLFDLDILNVTTTGWTMEQEIGFRRNRLERYLSGKQFSAMRVARDIVKGVVPAPARKYIKTTLLHRDDRSCDLDYFAYGGNRRAIRMVGRVG